MLFDTLGERRLSDDECFLCGIDLDENNRSDEHVIPRWAQRRFNLWNQELVLLNGTSIPYRLLTIPCCETCNTGALQPLESAMATATLEGVKSVRALDQTVLFTWLGKIFYGLLHRELFLLFDRRSPDDGSITSPELIEQFRLHHFFLQNVRVPMVFEGGFPASIFVYETNPPPDIEHQWDFRDNLPNMFISLRMGSVGIVATLQDGGAQEAMREELEQLLQAPLHPLQHIELCAMVSYKSLLTTRTPKYMTVEGDTTQIVQLPLGGLSAKPLFEDWDQARYAKILSGFLQCPIAAVFDGDTRVMTWLRKPDGTPNDISFDDQPWPPIAQGGDSPSNNELERTAPSLRESE